MDEDESGMVSDRRNPKCLVKSAELPNCLFVQQKSHIHARGGEGGEGIGISWTAERLLSPQEGLYSVE